eukprot:43236-Prymnesium_polylepis.1
MLAERGLRRLPVARALRSRPARPLPRLQGVARMLLAPGREAVAVDVGHAAAGPRPLHLLLRRDVARRLSHLDGFAPPHDLHRHWPRLRQ